jgi:hypothetical protein
MRAISPLIGAIALIGISITVAALVAPTIFRMASDPGEGGPDTAASCQNMAYNLESTFGLFGVNHSLSGPDDWVEVRVTNTGTIDIHDFFFELKVEDSGRTESSFYEPTADSQRPASNPLRPGRQATIKANITDDLTGSLKEVVLLNRPCPDRHASAVLYQI